MGDFQQLAVAGEFEEVAWPERVHKMGKRVLFGVFMFSILAVGILFFRDAPMQARQPLPPFIPGVTLENARLFGAGMKLHELERIMGKPARIGYPCESCIILASWEGNGYEVIASFKELTDDAQEAAIYWKGTYKSETIFNKPRSWPDKLFSRLMPF